MTGVPSGPGGFDALSGAGPRAGAVDPERGDRAGIGDRAGTAAGAQAGATPPAGIRTTSSASAAATRMVLVRHGEAVCNVSGVCGGQIGCEGLTDRGRAQIGRLRDRLLLTGELAGADALYASVLPRAIETAELLAPSLLGGIPGSQAQDPPRPAVVTECGLCELHPGEADGLSWPEFTERFGAIDWDEDPGRPIAPGGESWTGFVNRVDEALDKVSAAHPGALVVVACHAGVIEASLLSKLPVEGGLDGARLKLRTEHGSLTTWEVDDGGWRLLGYNDTSHLRSEPQGRATPDERGARSQQA